MKKQKANRPSESSGEILIVMPHPEFFAQYNGTGGHVSHFIGIADGFFKLGFNVDLVGGPGASSIWNNGNVVSVRSSAFGRVGWAINLIREVKRLKLVRRYEFIYIRYSAGFAAFLPILRQVVGDLPIAMEVNSLGSQRHAWYRPLDCIAIRSASLVTAVSHRLQQEIIGRRCGIRSKKIVVIPNGVDVSRFREIDGDPVLSRPARLGYLGILKKGYGLEELLQTIRQMKSSGCEIVLSIAGTGPIEVDLQNQCIGLPVNFDGVVARRDVPSWLAQKDVLVYTTSVQHDFQSPIKLFEYMSSGRPVVAARTEVVTSILENDALGFTYEIGNPDDMCRCFSYVFCNWSEALERARKAREVVARKHTWEERCRRIVSCLCT